MKINKIKILNIIYILCAVILLGFMYFSIHIRYEKQAYEQDLDLKINDHENVYQTYILLMRNSIKKKYEILESLTAHIKIQQMFKEYHIRKQKDENLNKEEFFYSQSRIDEIEWDIQVKQKEYERIRKYDVGDVYLNKIIKERQIIDSLETLKKDSKDKYVFL